MTPESMAQAMILEAEIVRTIVYPLAVIYFLPVLVFLTGLFACLLDTLLGVLMNDD